MQLKCLHGYFIIRENDPGEVSQFQSVYGFDISPVDDFFTFTFLVGAPGYSIVAGEYLGATAVATFEGKPWEILEANDLVYDFTQNKVVPIASIIQMTHLDQSGYYYLNSGLIVPGSITDDGKRVTEYSAFYDPDFGKMKYSEVTVE